MFVLIAFLLKEAPDKNFTEQEAKEILDSAFQSYKRSRMREDAKLNDFFALVSQLLPSHASHFPTHNPGTVATVEANELKNNDKEDVFYFSNGSLLPKAEVTDDDIEAAITALSCNNRNSPQINYDDLRDIDSFLEYSAKLEETLPILGGEHLDSPIYLNKIDQALSDINNTNNAIKISVNMEELQKRLAPPVAETPSKIDEHRVKKVGRFLAKTSVRPRDLLHKAHGLHVWKEGNGKLPLSKLSKSLGKITSAAKNEIVSSLKVKPDISSASNKGKKKGKRGSKDASGFSWPHDFDQDFTSQPNDEPNAENWKMFKGFEFTEFKTEALANQCRSRGKPKKKIDPKRKSATMILYEKLKERNKVS